ncbi:FAD-dependent oxidoreductase domain-containing protein 2-like, partial [Glandiceps talaboti]
FVVGHYDYLILGAGPSGLQMAYQMKKDAKNYLVLEGSDGPGTFFRTQPRHRTLISINKRFNPFPEHEYNMRHDWNSLLCDDPALLFRHYSKDLFPCADAFVKYIQDFVDRYKLDISYNTRISSIEREKDNGKFTLTCKDGRKFTCKVLLMATGALSEKLPDLKGIELCDTYSTHDIDQDAYIGKAVCVLGRGNSAFEVANHLAGHASIIHIYGEKKLKYAWDTHFVGDLRAVNNTVLDMYQLKSLHAYQAYKMKAVSKGENGKLIVQFEDLVAHWNPPGRVTLSAPYDKVILCTGFQYVDLSIFADDIKPNTVKHGKFPELTTMWETNVPDMYYLGTPMQSIDRQAASGFIHGFRYNVRTLYHLLQEKYFKTPYPRTLVDRTVEGLSTAIIDRVSTAASIYQMNNFLCDVMVVSDDKDSKAEYMTDLPKKYVLENENFKKLNYFMIVLQYGFQRFGEPGDHPNNFVHIPDFSSPYCGPFLHPTMYYYRNGELVEESDLLESLLLRFDGKEFLEENGDKQRNRVKNFVNRHLKLEEGKVYDERFITDPEKYKEIFTPLTEEEIQKLSKDYAHDGKCKPFSIDMKGMM